MSIHFEIMDEITAELAGHYPNFVEAKKEADRLCDLSKRTRHYSVMKIEKVTTTRTLDEAMREQCTRVHD